MDTSHLDLFDENSHLPSSMVEQIQQGNVSAVQESYASSPSTSLLTRIAEQATRHNQPDILSWAFTQGLVVAVASTYTENIMDSRIYTFACLARSLPIWKLLVAHGMPIAQHHDESLGDIISTAVYDQDIDILQFALENGCKPDEAFGYDSISPGATAVRKGSADILRLLLKYGWTPAAFDGAHIAAAEMGKMDLLRILVEEGKADLEEAVMWWAGGEEDEIGTALYRGARKGQAEAVEYLLGRGANVEYKDGSGRGVDWAAKEGGNQQVIQLVADSLAK